MGRRFFSLVLLPLLLFYAFPAEAAQKEVRTWQDEIVYSIMIDRFFDGNPDNNRDTDVHDPASYHGGDFAGVTKKLDYLHDMGFTALILSPVFDNDEKGYHGYWVNDFYKTDEHFGSLKEFKRLVKEAHKREMKILLDFDVHHVSENSPLFKDSEKQDWFLSQGEKQDTNDWTAGLPIIDQNRPEARQYLIEAAKWWLSYTGIDGFRMTDVQQGSIDFWMAFAQAVKSEKKDACLIADMQTADKETFKKYKEAGFDSYINYHEMELLRKSFSKPDESLERTLSLDPEFTGDQSLLLDHVTAKRFAKDAESYNEHPGTRWKLALSYTYTAPGTPIVFYGTEIALNGGAAPDNLKLMNFKTEQDLVEYITSLAAVRKAHPSLVRGDFELLYEEGGMMVFKRTYAGEITVTAINNTSKTQTVQLDESMLEGNKELRGTLNSDLVRSKDGSYTLVMDREMAEVYTVEKKSIINIPYLIVMGLVLAVFSIFIILIIKRSKHE
ncbi:alpha-amylase family glycosyl hydrolase [Bacillus massiliglaciei]|uniref:alpha-amylase family glycosyl hydrolase n=1 Tax=Bacillus massiliglaciei TaxID=1816693 RepID=UPI000DA6240F|nr:alpha-amylase family glycosyl hydrolase [Bacillus massiliglaciei]